MRLALAFLVVISAVPAAAQTVPLPAATPTAADAAQQLASLVLPREAYVALRVRSFEEGFAAAMNSNPQLATLEKTKPGITKAVAAAAREEATEAFGAATDLLQTDAAQIYRRRFTAQELRTLIGFIAGPTGKAMVTMSMEATGDTASQVTADRRAKAKAMFENPDATTKAELTKLIVSGLLPKLRTTGPEIIALSARRFDDVDKLLEAALPPRIEATIDAYSKRSTP